MARRSSRVSIDRPRSWLLPKLDRLALTWLFSLEAQLRPDLAGRVNPSSKTFRIPPMLLYKLIEGKRQL
jgi:hypothetical protein